VTPPLSMTWIIPSIELPLNPKMLRTADILSLLTSINHISLYIVLTLLTDMEGNPPEAD